MKEKKNIFYLNIHSHLNNLNIEYGYQNSDHFKKHCRRNLISLIQIVEKHEERHYSR